MLNIYLLGASRTRAKMLILYSNEQSLKTDPYDTISHLKSLSLPK
jgi:hypothetical protein